MNPYDYLGLGALGAQIQPHAAQQAQQALYNQEYLAYMANMQAQATPAMLNSLGLGLAAQAQFMPSPTMHRINAVVQEAERGWKTRDELRKLGRPSIKVMFYMLIFRIFHFMFRRYPWENLGRRAS